jgi:hypothetical protein
MVRYEKGQLVCFHLVEMSTGKVLLNSQGEPFEFTTADQAIGIAMYLHDRNPGENWMHRGDHKYGLFLDGNNRWVSVRL